MIKAKNGGREEHNKHRQCKRKEHNSIYNAGSMVQSKIKYYKSLIKIISSLFFCFEENRKHSRNIQHICCGAENIWGNACVEGVNREITLSCLLCILHIYF